MRTLGATHTPWIIFKFDLVKYKDFSSILKILDSFSVDSAAKSHVLHAFVNLTSYVYTFQNICKLNNIFVHFLIFVHIYTIFMNNVDFKSDTIHLGLYLKFDLVKYKDFSSILKILDSFSVR